MKLQPFLVGLTIVNLALLIVLLLSRTEPVLAGTGVSVLRGSALEIVDSRGRVRASFEVKTGASEQGGGLSCQSSLRLTNKAGQCA